MDSIFAAEGQHFVPTEWARGPWDPGLLHGGAPAALLAHAVEQARDDAALVMARFTVDLFRPVRLAPMTTSLTHVRPGRRIQVVDAFLHQDGQMVARASALMIRANPEAPDYPPLASNLPMWDAAPAFSFNIDEGPAFTQATQGRYVRDQDGERIAALWLRLALDFLPGRPLTPFERVAALSDYANPTGSITTYGRTGFINADISVHLHREMEGEWLCMQSPGRPSHLGVATTHAVLHDARGPLGSASVSALANKMPPRPPGKGRVLLDAAE